MKFYINSNGQLVVSDGLVVTDFKEVIPNTTDGAVEKHLPVVSVEGNVVTILVGSVTHPMVEGHYIANIILLTDKRIYEVKLTHVDTPSVSFVIENDEKPLEAYEYCNLHGLWKTVI